MNRLQPILLTVLVVVMGILVLGPYLDMRKVDAAIIQLEVISDAAKRYERHTGEPCTSAQQLVENPGLLNWRGPYLDAPDMLTTPWGGEFVIDADRGLVGMTDADHVPKKYLLGTIAELSMPIRHDPTWWPAHVMAD